MNREQEDKIIKQAQDILERRLGVKDGLEVNLRNIHYYAAYYLGAIQVVKKITDELKNSKPKGEDWVYVESLWKLITEDKRHMLMFLDGDEIRYKNHKRDKKGKLVSVDCCFVEQRMIITEKQ